MKLRPYKKKRPKRLIVSTRHLIFNMKKEIPYMLWIIRYCWRVFRSLLFIIRKKFLILIARLKFPNDKINFNKICWVNPNKIQYGRKVGFNVWHNHCRILEGDWDLSKKKFEDFLIYNAFKQRFIEKKKWEETKFYKKILKIISTGFIKWDCKNKEDLDKRFRKLDLLYYKIKREGYKSQKELSSFKECYARLLKPAILDEIAVVIARDGQLLFVDGRHRLSIARLIEIPLIPIIIISRHKKWVDFRNELIYFIKEHQDGRLLQPFTHPDLQDLPFKPVKEPLNLIKDNLSVLKGTLLDIGANMGYFSHKFEEEGFDCYAVEENKRCEYFLKKLKNAENKEFKIISKSIFEYNKGQDLIFDVVLILNDINRYSGKNNMLSDLIDFLKRLKVKELFLCIHKYNEFQNSKINKNFSSDQFVSLILKHSCLNQINHIGRMSDGRLVYKLTSKRFPSEIK